MFGTVTTTTAMTAMALFVCGAVTVGHAEDNEVQGGTDKRLLACDKLTDARDKLACFDSVVESLKVERAAASKPEQPGTQPAAVSSTENQSEAIAREPAATASGRDDAPEAAEIVPAPTPDGDDAAAGTGNGRAASTATEEEDDADDGGPVRARIVRSWQNLDGRFSVELDNGQIWRETQGTDVGLPAEGDRVEISEGLFGGHRMKIEDITRVAWVRRAE